MSTPRQTSWLRGWRRGCMGQFSLMFYLWCVPSCGSHFGLVQASFGSSARVVTQYVMRNLVHICRMEALSCYVLNQMCEVGVFVCLVRAGEMGCRWMWMNWCYMISPDVLISIPVWSVIRKLEDPTHVAARLTRHPTSTRGGRALSNWHIGMCWLCIL